jgi:acyl-CoA synthetase (AMP-forming)/AMP-acid ligase II
VLLDAAPAHATFLEPTGSRVVDLGSHVGLEIAGEEDAPGRDEEAVIAATGTETGAPLTHRELLADARATIAAVDLTAADHALAVLPFSHRLGLTASLVAPLLAGARVTTMARFEAHRALDIARADQITMLCGVPDTYAALLAAIEHGGGGRRPTALRICLCGGPPASPTLEDRWRSATGVVLTRAPAG